MGSVVAAIGATVSAFGLRGRPSAPLVYVGAGLLVLGSAAWSWHVYLRAADPRAFVQGLLPGWHFVHYSVFTLAGLALIGVALLRLGFPAWSGWLMIAGSLLLLVLYVILHDMPPFLYYLLGLVLGVVFFRGL